MTTMTSSRNESGRSCIDSFCASRSRLAILSMVAITAWLFLSQASSSSSSTPNKPKKSKFKNHKGEVVEPVYFENTKGKTAKAARVRNPWARVDRISVLGERNSGTRWITSELQRCFPQVEVKSELQRWKHWFQQDDGQEHLTTLVVAQFRDPYFWAEAMRHVPHHAPNHLYLSGDDKKDWKEFLTRPWTLGYRPQRDKDLPNKDEPGVCYENFDYNQLESCVEGSVDDPEYLRMFDKKTGLNKFGYSKDDPHDFTAAKPVYELKPDGTPFANIMEMRTAKIYNFLGTKKWNWVKDLVPVRYEQLLEDGTESLIALIEEITTYKNVTQLMRNCTPALPQKRPQRLLDPEMVNFITESIDWRAEEKLGYKKRRKQTKDDMKEYQKALKAQHDKEDEEEKEAAAEKKKEESKSKSK